VIRVVMVMVVVAMVVLTQHKRNAMKISSIGGVCDTTLPR